LLALHQARKGFRCVVEFVCILLGLFLLSGIGCEDGLSILSYRQSLCDGRGRQVKAVGLNFSFQSKIGVAAGVKLLVGIKILSSVFVRHFRWLVSSQKNCEFAPKKVSTEGVVMRDRQRLSIMQTLDLG
jgi:hypothetical protein